MLPFYFLARLGTSSGSTTIALRPLDRSILVLSDTVKLTAKDLDALRMGFTDLIEHEGTEDRVPIYLSTGVSHLYSEPYPITKP